jgi:hypothetical protein
LARRARQRLQTAGFAVVVMAWHASQACVTGGLGHGLGLAGGRVDRCHLGQALGGAGRGLPGPLTDDQIGGFPPAPKRQERRDGEEGHQPAGDVAGGERLHASDIAEAERPADPACATNQRIGRDHSRPLG